MDEYEIAAYVALYKAIIASAEDALAILAEDSDARDTDVFFCAKEIVQQLDVVYDIDSIRAELAEDSADE